MKRCLFLLPWLFLFFASRPEETLLFALAVLIHEGGHLIAIVSFGVPIERFSLTPLGAEIISADPYLPYRKEIVISLAGPMAGLLFCGGLVFLLRQVFSALILYFFFCNLFLSLFNLLPAKGLDGGRALFSLLCQFSDHETANSVLGAVHAITVFLLTVLGILLLKESRNPSLFCIALSLIFGEKEKKPRKSRSFFA